jgi:flagellar basal-body rod modification protein FlgD
MASVSGVLQHQQGTSQALAGVGTTPLASKSATSSTNGTTSSSSGTTSASATITSNDFLTLLVTELKNQDPTSDTDPNEYVNQLCEVNSLEQLVSINSTLTKDLGSSSTTAAAKSGGSAQTTTSTSPTAQAQAAYHANSLASQSSIASANSGGSAVSSIAAKLAPGNLSVPASNPSALRVGQSLSGLNQLQ